MMKSLIQAIALSLALNSGVQSVLAAPPAAPTGFAFTLSTAKDSAKLEWVDNATDEDDFELEFKVGSGSFQVSGFRPLADSTEVTFTGFAPGTPVTFRLRAVNADGYSDYSEEATVETLNFQLAASCVTLHEGGGFSRQLNTNLPGVITLDSTLPGWMSWDGVNFVLSGSDAPAGIVPLNFSATAGVHARTRVFYVMVINDAPVVTNPPAVTDLAGAATDVALDDFFDDPDMGRAAVMNTPAGSIQVGLYDDPVSGAPLTVDNFFAYAEAGRWEGTFFHRSVEQFVIQGGGYVPEPGAAEGNFTDVEEFPAIVNEYDAGRPNICGTISMAKLGGDPDSATSEFFVSLKDNISILDGQNGGFTVFGRVIDMAAVDQISAFDTATYTVGFGGAGRSFADWPLSAVTNDSPLVSQLASVSSVVEIPTISYSVSGGDPSVVTASLNEGVLTLTPVSAGQTNFTVTATDLDGATVEQVFVVDSGLTSYSEWATANGGAAAEDNSDGDSMTDLLEYAFGGDPQAATGEGALLPQLGLFVDAGLGTFDTISFRLRSLAPDLEYKVQTSTDLDTWDDLWVEGDPNGVLTDTVTDGDFSVLTVRQQQPQGSGDDRVFFRVFVTLEVPE